MSRVGSSSGPTDRNRFRDSKKRKWSLNPLEYHYPNLRRGSLLALWGRFSSWLAPPAAGSQAVNGVITSRLSPGARIEYQAARRLCPTLGPPPAAAPPPPLPRLLSLQNISSPRSRDSEYLQNKRSINPPAVAPPPSTGRDRDREKRGGKKEINLQWSQSAG